MLNSADIGLIPVQPKEEHRDYSLIAHQASAGSINCTTDLSAQKVPKIFPNIHVENPKPLLEARQQSHHRHNHDSKFLSASTDQIKRKRGRPRKYTLGTFPAQVTNTSCSLMSIASNLSTVTSTCLISADSVPSQITEPTKKPRMGRPPKSSYLSLPNAHVLNGVEMKESPMTSAANATVPTSSVSSTDQFQELVPAKFICTSTSSTLYPKIASFPHQIPISLTNGHTVNGINGVKGISSTSPSMPISYPSMPASQLKASVPILLEWLNNPFIGGGAGVGGGGTLADSTIPVISTPLTSNVCSRTEAGLLGRLLPQAGAAVCAARAAGLSGPHAWNPEMVGSFISTLPGCQNLAATFIDNEIDGPALLCLEQHDLISILKLKLGPAVKVFGAIRALREAVLLIPLTDFSADHASALAAVVSCFPAFPAFNSATQTTATGTFSVSEANPVDMTAPATLPQQKTATSTSSGSVVVNGVGKTNSASGVDKSSK